MDSGSSQEKLYVCPAPCPRFSSFVTPSFRLLSLHLASSLRLSEAQLCVVRDHILLTLLQEFWYISSLIDFLSSAIFLSPPPLPSFHCHLSSSPQNHFHLSSHTNILTEFLLVRKEEGGGRQESKGKGQDCIFHQSEFWEHVHKQIEKYRYASEVKMRKEVERKINTLLYTQTCTHRYTQ